MPYSIKSPVTASNISRMGIVPGSHSLTAEGVRPALGSQRHVPGAGASVAPAALIVQPKARRAEKVAARLAKMRRSAEQVDLDRDMTPAEKRERINMLTQEARVEVDAFLSMNPGVR